MPCPTSILHTNSVRYVLYTNLNSMLFMWSVYKKTTYFTDTNGIACFLNLLRINMWMDLAGFLFLFMVRHVAVQVKASLTLMEVNAFTTHMGNWEYCKYSFTCVCPNLDRKAEHYCSEAS